MAEAPQSNLTATLFTLALIYSGQFVVCVNRTYKQVLQKGERTPYQKVFLTFYLFIWITIALTVTLYFLLCAKSLSD
jgi:hypothetical protein